MIKLSECVYNDVCVSGTMIISLYSHDIFYFVYKFILLSKFLYIFY